MKIRARYIMVLGGSALALAALLLTDPDRGLMTALFGVSLVSGFIYIALAHLGRKGLCDYPEADMRLLFRKAGESPIGAGLALVALAIIFSALVGVFARSAHAQGIPAQAHTYLPTLRAELREHWPDHPKPAYFGGLIEHESCVSLASASCWSPTARLRTHREEGAGLGQITRAWHADGAVRFDALQQLRGRHPALAEWSWANVHARPDLQLRGVVLYSRDLWQQLGAIDDQVQRLAMTDAAYNGGIGRVATDRRACRMRPGCDPERWWGHVETTCTANRRALYGGRSACDINRHHVRDVLLVRAPKYLAVLPGTAGLQ